MAAPAARLPIPATALIGREGEIARAFAKRTDVAFERLGDQ
jgi:hypothetical protein